MNTFLPDFRRIVVALSVAAAIVLGFGGLLLQPTFLDDPAAHIELLASSPTAMLGVQTYVWSQVFWAIGLVGAGHYVSQRAPVLGLLGAVFSGLGAFGHAVYGGAMVLQVAVAADADTALTVLETAESAPFLPFMIAGLVATVLGIVLIGIGLIRGRLAPLWLPIALLVWVVVEFVLSSFVDVTTYLSVVIGVIAFAGLTVTLWRSDRTMWATAAESAGAPDRSQPQTPEVTRTV